MFKNDQQRAACCQAILRAVRKSGLWHDDGPTEEAKWLIGFGENDPENPTDAELAALREQRLNTLSHGEYLMVQAAWDTWGGEGKLRWEEALYALDEKNRGTLGAFFLAYSRGELDAFAAAGRPWELYGYLQP